MNALYRNPPVSTEQILHPERYRSRDLPVAVALPALAARLGDDWGVVETGVLGEMGWQLALAPYTGRVPARAAAQGWGGDRYALLRRGSSDTYAAAFQTVWDTMPEAGEFAAVAGTWLDRRTGYRQVDPDLLAAEPERHWVQGPAHWFVRRHGLSVTIVVAPGPDLAQALLTADYPDAYQCLDDASAADYGLDSALADLTTEIAAHPSPTALQRRAAIYLQRDDYEHAIADLSRVIGLQPDNADAYLDRGHAYYFQADDDAAIGDLTKVLDLRPGHYTAYLYRARAYAVKEDYQHADQDFAEGLRLYPSDPYLHEYRASTYWDRGELDRASADHEAAIRLLPDFADPDCRKAQILNTEGHVWQDKGDYTRALAAFTGALDLRPDDAQAWLDRADAYLDKGDDRQALSDYDRAVEIRPGFATAYLQRGYFHMLQEDYKLAMADFDKVIELEPGSGRGYYGRGYAYLPARFRRE